MKYQRAILLVALCVATSGCEIADTSLEDGAITLKNDVVTLRASGAPDAVINAAGDLQIGDKVVTINDAERGLLMLYYQDVRDVHQTGKEMGKVGAAIGGNALKDKLAGKSKEEQEQDAKTATQPLHALSRKMCQDQANIKIVQDQLSTQLAEFKPYGNIITQDKITSCQKGN
jgi:hypothetical protein